MFLLVPFIYTTTPDTIVQNNQFKNTFFLPTIQFVNEHKQKYGAFPNHKEFENWKLSRGWDNWYMYMKTSGDLNSDDCSFGKIPSGSYKITVWEGVDPVCYASWLDKYSFDDIWAINIKAMLVCFLIGIVLLIIRQNISKIVRYISTK